MVTNGLQMHFCTWLGYSAPFLPPIRGNCCGQMWCTRLHDSHFSLSKTTIMRDWYYLHLTRLVPGMKIIKSQNGSCWKGHLFPQDVTILVSGLSHALWWGHWSHLEWAVSSKGQPWLFITEVSAAPPTAPGHPHPVQHGPDRTKLFGHPLVLCVSRVANSSWSFRGVSFPSFQCSPPLGGNLEP